MTEHRYEQLKMLALGKHGAADDALPHITLLHPRVALKPRSLKPHGSFISMEPHVWKLIPMVLQGEEQESDWYSKPRREA